MNQNRLTGPERLTTRYGEPIAFQEGLYQLSVRTYAYLVPNGSWGETNIGLIDCDGESILIDTCWDLNATHEVLKSAESIVTRSPIERVINTHADGDHCWGNQLFKDRDIIATNACAAQLGHLRPLHMRTSARVARIVRGVPVWHLDKLGNYLSTMLKPYDFGAISLTVPNRTFSSELQLCVRGIDVVIKEVGPAHTDGDCIVYLPGEKVAYGADILFVGVTPVAWSGPIENIVAALRWILSLDVDHIVPGHGPLATRADVQRLIDYWEFAQEGIYRGFHAGMSPFAATHRVLHSTEFRDLGFLAWDSPERLLTSCYAMYRAWGVTPTRLSGKIAALNQQRQQAMLASGLPDATPRSMHGF